VVQGLLEGKMVNPNALGTLTPVFVTTGCKPGIYERNGASGWTHEGKLLPKMAAIHGYDDYSINYSIKSIDGKSPGNYYSDEHGRYRYYFIPVGVHKVLVSYESTSTEVTPSALDPSGRGRTIYTTTTTRSSAVISYTFEEAYYVCTGEVEGKKIIFRIERD
jgi:hypothetical protein